MTPRQRISTLERRLGTLAASVGQQEPSPSSQRFTSVATDESRIARDRASETKDQFSSVFPTHFNPLFDNELIELGEQSASQDFDSAYSIPCSRQYLDDARRRLQRLILSKPEVEAIAEHANTWISIFYHVFMRISSIQSGQQLVARYEAMLADDAHPTAIGTFLLSLAITAQQLPQGFESGPKNLSDWTMEVLSELEGTVIAHNGLSGTLEGIELMSIYLRLLLRLGRIRILWLALRRTIALAELLGLPRLSRRGNTSSKQPRVIHGQTLWRTICSTDRMAGMIFNLPSATSGHRLPAADLIDSDGNVVLNEYAFRLTGFAIRVQDLEDIHAEGLEADDVYANVLSVDHDLRSLSAQTPASWWKDPQKHPLWVQMVQFWQHYALIRTHLPSAMLKDGRSQFVYSRITCLQACQDLATRYLILRPQLPGGFFLCRVVDIQIFTAAVFLLLVTRTCDDSFFAQIHAVAEITKIQSLLAQVVGLFESICNQAGSEFLRDAVDAIRSLDAHFDTVDSNSQSCSLNVPLLGQIRIKRKRTTAAPNHNNVSVNSHQPMVNDDGTSSISGQSLFPDTPSWLWELDTDPLQPGLGLNLWSDLTLFPDSKDDVGNVFV